MAEEKGQESADRTDGEPGAVGKDPVIDPGPFDVWVQADMGPFEAPSMIKVPLA